MLTIVQLSSSILFFGHAVYNYRSVGTVIEEAQSNTLKDYHDSLRSNRQRKTFNKLLKETIRQNDGNVQKGRAEVISTIRNIKNKDEVFAALTRANKNMNRKNVRFAVRNGEITLNGVSVDMKTFANMEKNEVVTFLTTLPNKPNPTIADVKNMTTTITKSFDGLNLNSELVRSLAIGLVKLFGSTDRTIKEKIINAVFQFIRFMIERTCYMEELDRIFSNIDKYFRLVNMVNGYFQQLINVIEEKYTKWSETRDSTYEEPYFFEFSLDIAKRAVQIFNLVSQPYFNGTNLTEFGLRKLQEYFSTWFASQVYEFEERQRRRNQRRRHSVRPRLKKSCTQCGGYFYIALPNL